MKRSKRIRVYVLTLVGSNESLNVRAGKTGRLFERIAELRLGQRLTIRVTAKKLETLNAMTRFGGW